MGRKQPNPSPEEVGAVRPDPPPPPPEKKSGSDTKVIVVSMSEIKTGDTVFHGPTKEKWIVAVVDSDRGQLSWCGWPKGWADIGDYTLVKSCSDEDRIKLLKEMAKMGDRSDHRYRYAVAKLAELDEKRRCGGPRFEDYEDEISLAIDIVNRLS